MDESNRRSVTAVEGLAFCSLKNLIRWGDHMKLGQSNIDTQHERIFKLALEACELSREPECFNQLMVVFDAFGGVLKAHFRYEEAKLTEIHYPKLEEHRAEHEAMLSELEFVAQRLENKGVGWAFQQQALVILNFMIGVTVGHILQSDTDYARYMQEVGARGDLAQPAS
ncbi:bacteriohemerythrin [Propionivibrio sp.]|uniref:bacteriohemerythrin n=1 Tax=Propionivibrio sp. TaxID=2212460 RepID=UPI003BF190FB